MHHLVVVRSFGPYRVGEIITDQSEMKKVVASEHGEHVVRISPLSKA